MSDRQTMLLIDMSALVFRSHYAFIKRPLVRSDGMATSGMYGTCNTIVSILKKYKPNYVVCARDAGVKTFRHEKYEAYKANRPPCPPELAKQLEMLGELAEAFNLTSVMSPGYEADDIIGSYTTLAQRENIDVFILSGDKDFMQLLKPGSFMLLPHKSGEYQLLDHDGVLDKIGVRPDQVIDYLALLGDASDNVPGAPGVGKVTAGKLLSEYDNIDQLYVNLDQIKQKGLVAKLSDHKDQVMLSRDLVTIKTDMDEIPKLSDTKFNGIEISQIKPFLEKMEFPKILSRLEEHSVVSEKKNNIENTAHKFINLQNLNDWNGFLREAIDADYLALYPEFEGRELQAISLSLKEHEAYYLSCDEDVLKTKDLGLGKIISDISELPAKLKIGGYDIKSWLNYIKAFGGDIQVDFDVYLESSILEPGKSNHSLEKLSSTYINYHLIELGKKGNKKMTFSDLPEDEKMNYASERASVMLGISKCQREELDKLELKSVYESLELPLLPVMSRIESNGFAVDRSYLLALSEQAEKEIASLKEKIFEIAGEEFNINSTQQLGPILFEKLKLQEELGLKKVKKTKTGYSTDSSVLESIKSHPIGSALLRYRFLTKLKSTYLDALPKEVLEKTGRIHTHYLQNGTATGRLSSHQPNLQNIPMKTDEGAKIRQAFIPGCEENVLISADYSQIELRVLAHFCKDDTMKDIFSIGGDIHRETAAKVYQIDPNEVTRQQRSSAKAVNFGLLYGMGPRHLSQDTGMSFSDAQKFIKSYFETFPSIKQFMKDLIEQTRSCGYATTLSGRRRALPDLESSNGMLRNAAENMALNTPIQGSAADIIKWAMIRLDQRIELEKLPLKMILQVHDELVFECPTSNAEEMKSLIVEEMENRKDVPVEFGIPLEVQAAIGNHWLEAH